MHGDRAPDRWKRGRIHMYVRQRKTIVADESGSMGCPHPVSNLRGVPHTDWTRPHRNVVVVNASDAVGCCPVGPRSRRQHR